VAIYISASEFKKVNQW